MTAHITPLENEWILKLDYPGTWATVLLPTWQDALQTALACAQHVVANIGV